MRNAIIFLGVSTLTVMLTGCASQQQKLGTGMGNMFEVVRMGEMRRSIEQTAIFESPEAGYTVGAVRGFSRTIERTGLGVWDTATFLVPYKYDPVSAEISKACDLKPGAVYPESYRPGLISGSIFDTDTYTGFSGGDIAPFVPGSRFKVFDN